jgi:hypothetical protein
MKRPSYGSPEYNEAQEKISAKLAEAEKMIAEAQEIADETGVSFTWDGPTYGMGGHYEPQPKNDEWENSACFEDESESGWSASSHSC